MLGGSIAAFELNRLEIARKTGEAGEEVPERVGEWEASESMGLRKLRVQVGPNRRQPST
jgi:hypothetical protein